MRYVALKSEHALATLEALRRGEEVDEQQVLEIRGSGDDIERVVQDVAGTLYEIKLRFPERLRRRDPSGGAFEAMACGELHRRLPFDPQMLADYEWWTWLAVFHLRELVEWRHGGETGRAAPANFGIGNGSENLLYRMWLRADAAYDPSRSDPYELARRGDQDFWRSHVFRQGYGRCRSLVRALIRYQFPDGPDERPTLKIDQIRELAKRLRRLHPNVIFEYLDEAAAYQLVAAEAERAKHALAGSVAT
ncbi:MAG: hypothetical protein KatS3mg109_1773 [Pirellulaceae bacterium]|nr:MAG: hypothetical protein KatS3mg109_1773 [Pirellulaceae bacterium]